MINNSDFSIWLQTFRSQWLTSLSSHSWRWPLYCWQSITFPTSFLSHSPKAQCNFHPYLSPPTSKTLSPPTSCRWVCFPFHWGKSKWHRISVNWCKHCYMAVCSCFLSLDIIDEQFIIKEKNSNRSVCLLDLVFSHLFKDIAQQCFPLVLCNLIGLFYLNILSD